MPTTKKILVPLDFSDAAEVARQRAEALAEATQAELLFLHVIDDTPMILVDGAGYLPAAAFVEYEQRAIAKLESCVLAAQVAGIPARRLVLHGSPAPTIVDVAKRETVDMIVMGTHGRTGFRHFMLGSVAERVVRTSPVPVLTVRGTATKAELPIEGSEPVTAPA